jgi:NAD(P)-dependent dehydrogenase (short-subunit alcohol dehydrogenase family)
MEQVDNIAAERKVALVTGAGRGVGRAIALALAQAGYALCLAARTREELDRTRELSGLAPAQSLIVLIDLAQEDAPDCLIETACDHFGRLDVLVNNAGWAPPRTPLIKLRNEDQDRILAVNLRAPIALARLAAMRMATQLGGGAIINLASSAARRMPPGETVYAAAKAGLIAFTHAAFAELRDRGTKLSVIIPGLIDTSLIPQNKRLDRSLMLRPEDIAAAVMTIIQAPAGVCPIEMVLEPQRDPMRGVN